MNHPADVDKKTRGPRDRVTIAAVRMLSDYCAIANHLCAPAMKIACFGRFTTKKGSQSDPFLIADSA